MALFEQFTRPNTLGTTTTNTEANKREIDTKAIMAQRVREAYYATAMLSPRIHMNHLKNTGTAESKGVGTASVKKMDDEQVAGPTPDPVKIGQNRIHVDTEVVSRNEMKWLANRQSNIVDITNRVSKKQGEAMARFVDQAYMIQGIKAGLSTTSAYRGLTEAERFYGGTQQQLANVGMLSNSDAIYNSLLDLQASIEQKTEMVLAGGDYVAYLRPKEWMTLAKKVEPIVRNYDYEDGFSFKWRSITVGDIEVVSCAWLPSQQNITNHLLSNASNNNAFNGDFTKVWGLVLGIDAIFDGWNIPITTNSYEPDGRHTTVYETYAAFTVGIDDAKHAAVLTIA